MPSEEEARSGDEREEDMHESEEGNAAVQSAPRDLKSKKRLKRFTEKAEKKGIVYLSRLPPHMVRGGWNPLKSLREYLFFSLFHSGHSRHVFENVEATETEAFIGTIWQHRTYLFGSGRWVWKQGLSCSCS